MSKVKSSAAAYAIADKQMSNLPEAGFTITELMVVVAIMGLLAGAMVLNLNGQRASRDLKIAQSQLVTNIRKIQSYTLSSRITPTGQAVQYYVMKFDPAQPNQYSVQAMYNISSSPQYLTHIETIYLPLNIRLAASQPIVVLRQNDPLTQVPAGCALAVFSVPFARTFFNDGCSPGSLASDPYGLQPGDDYKKIVDFVSNVGCSVDPVACTASVDSKMTITLTDSIGNLTRKVLINGITGSVCPTEDGIVCLTTN